MNFLYWAYNNNTIWNEFYVVLKCIKSKEFQEIFSSLWFKCHFFLLYFTSLLVLIDSQLTLTKQKMNKMGNFISDYFDVLLSYSKITKSSLICWTIRRFFYVLQKFNKCHVLSSIVPFLSLSKQMVHIFDNELLISYKIS